MFYFESIIRHSPLFLLKKLILQSLNHYFIISFIKFVAMIMLQILKLFLKIFIISTITLLFV